MANHASARECWLEVKRGRLDTPGVFYYLDAVEEALCFGWIDSTQKRIGDRMMQRFSPRRKGSPWSELNKERVRRLERQLAALCRKTAAWPGCTGCPAGRGAWG